MNLERCDVMIHLNADPQVAFERIKDDPDADKFETIEYVKKQAEATKRAYEELKRENPALSAFKGIPNVYIDTTNLTTDETFSDCFGRAQKACHNLKRPKRAVLPLFFIIHYLLEYNFHREDKQLLH